MSRKLCKFILVAILGTISSRTFAFTKAAIAVGGPGEQQISGVWDTGNITISFKDEAGTVYHETVAYGQFSTFASIASAFGAKFSNDYYCSGLWAYASGTTITIVAKNHSSLSAFSIYGPTTSFVAKAIPIITWPSPVPVPTGTALSSLQLNAVANIPGTFTYTPAAGYMLMAGTQPLSVSFAPADTADYTTTTVANSITVLSGTKQDSGTITLSVNTGSGYIPVATTTYGNGSTPASVAQGLAVGAIPNSPVYVSSVDNALFIESTNSGSSSNYPFLLQTTSWDQSDFPQPSFAYPAITGQLGGGSDASSNPHTVYNFHISYDTAGNVIGYTDSIAGTAHAWGFAYDSLNRLAGGSTSQAGNPTPNYCWSYDSFGNRLQQVSSSVAFGAQDGGASACPMQADSINNLAEYYNDNQVAVMNSRGTTSAPYIDDSGEMLTDGRNWYLYDAEGRACASATTISGGLAMTGYIYNAEGNRVSKGSITSWSCDLATNGYSSLTDYVLGSTGETLSEVGYGVNAARTWQRTFVYADNKLIATYDPNGLHYRLTDWLGSLRVATDYAGVAESTCTTLPFGEANSCSTPLDQHIFTGKERDSESGNDYFLARYYSSAMGRFMSPDWSAKEEPVPYAKLDNPQSLNLYAYVLNSPLTRFDVDGHQDPQNSQAIDDGGHVIDGASSGIEGIGKSDPYPLFAEPTVSKAYANYLKFEENSIMSGWNKTKQLWFNGGDNGHGGGTPTIAWGHLILSTEDFSKGIKMQKADDMFTADLARHVQDVRNNLHAFVANNEFESLVDLAFNCCANTRPLRKYNLGESPTLEDFMHYATNAKTHKVDSGLRVRRTEDYDHATTGNLPNVRTMP